MLIAIIIVLVIVYLYMRQRENYGVCTTCGSHTMRPRLWNKLNPFLLPYSANTCVEDSTADIKDSLVAERYVAPNVSGLNVRSQPDHVPMTN